MGPRRQIPIVKTQYLLRKTHFLTPKGNVRGNTLDNIYIILTGGKTPSGYCFKTPLARKCLKCLFCLICLLNHLPYLYVTYIKLCAYPRPVYIYTYCLRSLYLQHNLVLYNLPKQQQDKDVMLGVFS